MENLVLINKDLLKIISGSFGADGLPMPYVKEIFLIETQIAGTSFLKLQDIEPQLKENDFLVFTREANNKYDALAIIISDATGHKLGFVPKEQNQILARLMDGGKLIFGKLVTKQWFGSWLKIIIKVYLRDL